MGCLTFKQVYIHCILKSPIIYMALLVKASYSIVFSNHMSLFEIF